MIFLAVAMLFGFVSFVNAEDITINRIVPSQVGLNQSFNVILSINNPFNVAKQVIVTEPLADIEPLDNLDKIIYPTPVGGGMIAIRPIYYEWDLNLNPNKITKIVYKVRSLFVGDLVFGNAVVYDSGNEFYSNDSIVRVVCNRNKVCETKLYEDYFTCPEDCSSGGSDGVCDLVNDGIVDPDCEAGTDLDYVINYCDNGLMDIGELGIDCGGVCANACDSLPFVTAQDLLSKYLNDIYDLRTTLLELGKLEGYARI